MDNSTIAVIFTGIGLVIMLAEKIFGGGSKLTSAFHVLDKKTSDAITALDVKQTGEITRLRLETIEKIEMRDNNSRVGFEAVTANMHLMKEGLLQLRSDMAEQYMRRESFYKSTDELKKDFKEKHDDLKREMHEGFLQLRTQLGEVAKSIETGRKTA